MSSSVPEFDAICLDTCIFDGYGIALEKGHLKQLEQFAGGPVKLLIPDIVFNEVSAHLRRRVGEAHAKIKHALRDASTEFLSGSSVLASAEQELTGGKGADEVAKERLDDFCRRTGATIVESTRVNISQLLDIYFSGKSPFEASGKKKEEFPDAIALLSLESWAEEHDNQILVVSDDHGWRDFCEHSKYLTAVPKLGDALSRFHPHQVGSALLIKETKAAIRSERSVPLLEEVTTAIRESLDQAVIVPHATSRFMLDDEGVEAEYVSHQFYKLPTGDPAVHLIQASADLVVIQLRARVSVSVTGTFDLAIYDSVDKESVSMGTESRTVDEEYDIEALVSLRGDFDKGLEGVEMTEIEIEGEFGDVDFGEIELEFSEEDRM